MSKLIIITINFTFMTRGEEIKQKALSKYPQGTNRYNKFIEGARWADKTWLERVLKYLEVEHPTFFEHFGEEIRKAMEE